MRTNRKRPSALPLTPLSTAAALALLAMAQAASAQIAPADSPPPAREALDTVIVTGIRASLQKAVELKRDASQVMDVITAQDVGKLPDENVAEALQRITGVQVTRVFGEGQSVSVRGLPLVRVEVDGRTLLGFSARLSPPENEQLGRNSGLDTVPSGLFGRIEVRKSPLASQVEGGLSGSINLATPNPLDFKEFTVAARAQAVYSDVTGKTEPALSGLVAGRLSQDIGYLIAVDATQRTSTTQSFERNNFFNRVRIGAGTAPGTSNDLNGDGVADISGELLQYEHFVVDRSRFGVTAELQGKVTNTFEVLLEGIYSKMKTERAQDFMSWRYGNRPITNPVFEGNFIVAGDSVGQLQQAGVYRAEPTVSQLFAFSTKYTPGRLSVRTDLSTSRGTIEQTIRQITIDTPTTPASALVPGRFDYRTGVIPSLNLGAFDVSNFANYRPATNGIRSNLLLGRLDETVGKIDAQYSVNMGVLSKVSAGLRFRNLDATSEAFRSQKTLTRDEIGPYLTTVNPGQFLPDIVANIPRGFLTTVADRDFILQRSTGGLPLDRNSQRDYDLNEKASAAYVMADFDGELAGMPFTANAGVRAITTNFRVRTNDTIGATPAPTITPILAPLTSTNTYNNVLPSANIVFNVNKDFLVRFAAARTMQQAGVAELAPSLFVNTTARNATSGNASLKPTISDNFDVSFELYGARSSLLSGAVFYKDVKDAIAQVIELRSFTGFESLGNIPFTKPFNVGSAKVKGFELGVQRFFDFLPAPFDGFGVIANYTFSDAKGDGGMPLVGVSKNSYNLVGLYEKGPFSARLAYNYRDKAAFEFTEGRPSYVDKRSQLDFQMGYDISKYFSVQFIAQNLMPKDSATVEFSQISPVALNSYALSERRFSVGVRVKL